MSEKRTAVIRLREQEIEDNRKWCDCLKAAHRLGLTEGRRLGSMSAMLNFTGVVVVEMLMLLDIIPKELALLGGLVVLIWIILTNQLEKHLAKKRLKEHNSSVDELETNLIKKFDEQMVIKKGDK